jgi:hypothetical protein
VAYIELLLFKAIYQNDELMNCILDNVGLAIFLVDITRTVICNILKFLKKVNILKEVEL